jgi:hypothetical protein
MPGWKTHVKFYDELAKIVPNFKYDSRLVRIALDREFLYDKIPSHRNFWKFREAYKQLERSYKRFSSSNEESLRYIWVNHLVVDFVFNDDLGVFPYDKSKRFALWKVIAEIGLPYLRYGKKLLKRLGMSKKGVRLLRTKMEKPPGFFVAESLPCWRKKGPHYAYRLIADPEQRRTER